MKVQGGRVLAVALASVVLCSCVSRPGADRAQEATASTVDMDSLVPCGDLFRNGVTTNEQEMRQNCLMPMGEGEGNGFVGVKVESCVDGRRLVSSLLGWGYEGEPWNRVADSGEGSPVPRSEMERCTGEG